MACGRRRPPGAAVVTHSPELEDASFRCQLPKLYSGVNIKGREGGKVYEEAGRSRGEKGWSVGAEEGRSRGEEKDDAVSARKKGGEGKDAV